MGILLNDIVKTFGTPPSSVIKNVSLEIKQGELVAITGRSGSGKSTLLYIMSSLDPPSSGTVEIDGGRIDRLSIEELHRFRNLKMGFVFQFHYLLPELSALENILMPAMKLGVTSRQRDLADQLLRDFGLGDKRSRLPSQLSGGETQRVAIARALVMEPNYLFADEPTGNLDTANGNAVMEAFRKINLEKNMTVIFVTHDSGFAHLAPRRIHMIDGQINEDIRDP